MAKVRVIAAKGPTGRLLRDQLEQAGLEIVQGGEQAIISYGVYVPNPQVPTLNARAGALDKYRELVKMRGAGIRVPDYFLPGDVRFIRPVLGRQLHHARGKGIRLYREGKHIPLGKDQFFTRYIEKQEEYRVWAYRRKTLGLYQKVKRYPATRKRLPLVWNWENGYAFEFVHPEARSEAQNRICELGWQAVEALGLDFGASDVIVGRDGVAYVLEVNTAPGVEELRQGFAGLVNKMVKWAELGMPKRKGKEADGGQ